MAAKILLLIIFAITVAAEAAPSPLPPEWAAANRSISAMDKIMQEAFDGVNAAATPDKKKEALDATLKQMLIVTLTLAKAKQTGDEKKVVKIASSYEVASGMVIKAPPTEKLRAMEDTFNAVAAPDPTECPKIDESFCETFSIIAKLTREVITAAPRENKEEVIEAVRKQRVGAERIINKAYAQGEEKKIPVILAAYKKAADAVIAAAPADKFKVMEEAFTAATARLASQKED